MSQRGAGVLLHPTSLPGPHGIGGLGTEAYQFADFLTASRQSWWQMLPVHPPGKGDSPYNATSAFAGSPLLISLELLQRVGLLKEDEIEPPASLANGPVNYAAALRYREPRLRKAFERFEQGGFEQQREWFDSFCNTNAGWLEDYALFAALRRHHGGQPWYQWPEELRTRQPAALQQASSELAREITFRRFQQFLFARQWWGLRRYCARRGIGLVGDLPIFLAPDSVDVWRNPELFRMSPDGHMEAVAGVPPDAFAVDGQLWGNPLYDWKRHQDTDYAWWGERLRVALQRFDVVRVDHFIGFVRTWEVPAEAKTAREGSYQPGPGAAFFNRMQSVLGRLPLIAEDLGVVIPEVTALREEFGLPGMRVLQFAFGGDPVRNTHLPHNHERNSVVYTGTHDNDTTVGWYRARSSKAIPGSGASAGASREEQRAALRYAGGSARYINWAMMRLAYGSVANTAIVPAQDLLGLGSTARMNVPGTAQGNWRWRLRPGVLNASLAERLAEFTETFGRAPNVRQTAAEPDSVP